MKKALLSRVYNFSDAKLVTNGLEKAAFIRRDFAEFERFGFTTIMIEALETAIGDFAETVTDVEALNDQVEITMQKNTQAEVLRVAIRQVMIRVGLVFGNGTESAKYRKFGTEALAKQTDAKLLLTAKNVVQVGNECLTQLASAGLTPEMLNEIRDLAIEFENLVIDVRLKIAQRDIIRESRVVAGNSVYTMMSRYCLIGQAIWETHDAAKRNDYVIYNTKTGKAPT